MLCGPNTPSPPCGTHIHPPSLPPHCRPLTPPSLPSQLQTSGLICIFSLKNPSHPEFSFVTDSGVMSLHFHPEYSNLLAVGCYDGTVRVYDVHTGLDEPIYRATVETGKHQDPVWQIFWQVGESVVESVGEGSS